MAGSFNSRDKATQTELGEEEHLNDRPRYSGLMWVMFSSSRINVQYQIQEKPDAFLIKNDEHHGEGAQESPIAEPGDDGGSARFI
jgi:hypothetical protein